MQAAAELDLAAVGAKRLGLQIEQDQPRSAAIGNADADRLTIWHGAEAWLHNESDAFSRDLPWRVIGQALVGKGGLRPAGVEEADLDLLAGKVGGCRLHHATVDVGAERGLSAFLP